MTLDPSNSKLEQLALKGFMHLNKVYSYCGILGTKSSALVSVKIKKITHLNK